MEKKTDFNLNHSLILQQRKTLSLTGVTDVDNFNDKVLLIYTSLGELTVRGRNLCVESFSTESGELTAHGDIKAMIYGDRNRQSKPNVLRKIFR